MEYCNGGDLRKAMMKEQNSVYKLSDTIVILADVIRGLEVVHKNGIIHRDVKAENILICLDEDGKKVTFF